MENESTSPGSNSKYQSKLGNGELHLSNDSFTSNEAHEQEQDLGANEISAEECDKFREVLENRCSSVENSPHHDLLRKDSQSSIEREIAALNKEMEQIQIECQEIVEAHSRERTRVNVNEVGRSEPYRSPRMVPRMGTKLDYIKQMHGMHDPHVDPMWNRNEHLAHLLKDSAPKPKELKRLSQEEKEKDTSTTSAYNTGDSCRSTPLTLELNQVSEEVGPKSSLLSLAHPKPSLSDSDKMVGCTSQMNGKVNVKEWNSDGDAKKRGVSKSQSNGSFSEKTSQTPLPEERTESLQDLYAQYADVMYTNRANLEHTIMVQQKLFQQQLRQGKLCGSSMKQNGEVVKGLEKGKNIDPAELEASASPQTPTSSGPAMEWVVKRRADGSRYITRRPIRSKLLRERAKKVAEERGGMTTDDDAVSELKIGRYWSKEDRKRHLEKAKDYKKRKEMIIKQKMETLKENDELIRKQPNIVELSHRKMNKHKGKKVLDNFTTVQEMLAHGNRESHGKNYNPLLSVTTV